MNSTKVSNNFIFLDINFLKFHHTDSSNGVVRNYIGYMKKGTGRIVSKSKIVEISQGDVFFIPNGYAYQSYWYGSNEINFISLGFTETFTNDNLNFEAQVIDCDEETKKMILDIKTNRNSVSCEALSLFYGVLSKVKGKLEGSFENRKKIILDKIKNCIRQDTQLTLKQVAESCDISLPYLYLLFKENENITPNEYRQKALCEKAAQMLNVTDKSVEEISSELGFSSSSYFRKILKKHLGQTPREIRNTPKF